MHGLFCMGFISGKLCRFLLMFLTHFISLIVLLFFLSRSPSLILCMVFDSISSNIDGVLSINPSANIFGDFNVHHKDGLPILVELINLVNSAIISVFQIAYSDG